MTMAKLAPPKKASKPTAPKKPTSRSKTGNAACSEAASNWQLSLRGKAALDPETYRTLAKCRSMNRTAKMAEAQGRTGKLSAMGESAVKARLQSRFDSGLITQKARTERLDMLLKQRSQRGKAAPKAETPVVAKPAMTAENKGTYGDYYFTPEGKYVSMSGSGGMGSSRVGARDINGKMIGWYDRKELRFANEKQRPTKESEKASERLSEISKEVSDLREKNARLLIGKDTTDKLRRELSQGRITKEKYDELVQKGYALSDKDYAMSGEVQKQIDAARSRLVQPGSGEAIPPKAAKKSDVFDVTTQRLAPTASAARVLSPVLTKPLKSTVKAVKGKLLAKAESTSGVATLRTESIKADPERFQYKMNTAGPVGVTDQFKETKVWNRELAGVVQVWKDPGNGQTFVVNGHHRFELAQRLGVKRLNVQYIQAKDAAEARTKGALTNIAEGRGTSVDAGKFFREQGDLGGVVETLKKKGISLSEKTASEGLALAKTAPKIWRDVVDEMTPVSRAVAIGKADLRHEDQLQIYRKATEGNWRSGKVEEFATELKRAPLVKSGSASLFGDDEFVNTAEHRAALADRFKTQLKSGKKLFGTVARSRNAGRLESAGNKIDRESSAAIAQSNDRALMAFDIERKFGSRTSRLLDRYATQLAQGEKIDRVYGGFEARVTRALQRDLEKPFEARLAKRKARLAAMAR